ncbi:MAG: DMT family transporter [Chloroflexi bacterium]|nr:DMT family transporter [Chloroflexota bacterium]
MTQLAAPAPPFFSKRLRADLMLLLVAMIWGSAFAAQRAAAQHLSPHLFNALRYFVGAAAIVLLIWRRGAAPARLSRSQWAQVGFAGLLLFGGAAFQQMGLSFTTAGNAGFITGLYVVIIPVVLSILHRRLPPAVTWAASLLAAGGLFLLSTGGSLRLAPGDALELVCAFFWAGHVIWLSQLVQRVPVLHLAVGQNLVCAALSLAAFALFEQGAAQDAAAAWLPILYTGILSIGVGYTLQAYAQRTAPPADAAVILSSEAACAALFGWLLLNERLGAVQLAGCGLMMAGMLLAQMRGGEKAAE